MIKDKFYWVETEGGFCPVYTLFPDSSCPAVLFCHDYKGSSQESNRFFWRLSRALYEKGIGSVRFDYNGFGNSTGDSTKFTVTSGINDTVAVFQQVAGLPGVDVEKLAVLGLGMGGRIASYLIGNSEDIKAGILLNPANTHFKSAEEIEELEFGYEGDTAWDGGWEFSKKLFSADDFGKGASDLAESETPILLVSGYDDEFIFHKTSEEYTVNTKSIKHEEVMNADHFFSSPESGEDVVRLVTTFLGKILLGLEEKASEEEPAPVEKMEMSTAPPLATQIEKSEIATAPEPEESTEEQPESGNEVEIDANSDSSDEKETSESENKTAE